LTEDRCLVIGFDIFIRIPLFSPRVGKKRMHDNFQKSLGMNYNALINRILGGACGMAAGFACGINTNDEFLTLAFGVLGALAGLGLGFIRALVASLAVVLGVNLYLL